MIVNFPFKQQTAIFSNFNEYYKRGSEVKYRQLKRIKLLTARTNINLENFEITKNKLKRYLINKL